MLSAAITEVASESRAVEVEPCKSNEESRYPQEEPAQAGSSYSSSGTVPDDSRQTRSKTGSLPLFSPSKMTLAEEMNSKTA